MSRSSISRILGHALVAAAAFASSAGAQAILHPNQIQVDFAFTNTNPVVVAELARVVTTPGYAWASDAVSIGLTPALQHESYVWETSRTAFTSEITVESSDSGIPYFVGPWGAAHGNSSERFYLPAGGYTAPIRWEPEPDGSVVLRECAALLHFVFFDPAGTPTVVTGGYLESRREAELGGGYVQIQARDLVAPGVAEAWLLVRGDGQMQKITARFTTGTDPYSDMLTYEFVGYVAPTCDQVVEVHAQCDGGGGSSDPLVLGRIAGEADILGEHENPESPGIPYMARTFVRATGGPWSNYRFATPPGDPSSGPYTLPNLMPSTVDGNKPYSIQADFSVRDGYRLASLTTPGFLQTVGNGEVIDVGDAFVIDPGFVRGDLLFATPPVPPPPAVAPLAHFRRQGDAPSAQPSATLANSSALYAGFESDPVPDVQMAFAWGSTYADFEGDYDPVEAQFVGQYELPVGGLHRSGATVEAPSLTLHFDNMGTPSAPLSYLYGFVRITDLDAPAVHLAPGEISVQPQHVCFSHVVLSYYTTGAPFCAPRLAFDWRGGDSELIDFEGRHVHRHVEHWASGTPLSGSNTTGTVVTALPEGDYVLHPEVTSQNPGGGTSSTQLMPIDLHVGCREIIGLYQDFVLDATPLPACAESTVVTLDGRTRGTAPVARITYQIGTDPPIEWCYGCGVEPAFSIPVALADGDNTVRVTAETDDGRVASRTTFSRFAREPSATDRRAVPPLRVTHSGATLSLAWEDITGSRADVYRGTIDSLHVGRAYDHAGVGACDLAGGTTTLPVGSGSSYFLVGAPCDWGDSSLGRDSFGRERPQALIRCR